MSSSRSDGSTRSDDATWRPQTRRVTFWSAVAGLAVAGGATLLAWSWRDELPAQVASLWSSGGGPDDTMAPGTFIGISLGITVVMMVIVAPIGLAWGHTASIRRTVSGAMVWSGSLAASLLLVTFGMQRGVADVSTVAMPGWALALALLGPVVPAVVAAALVPGDPPMPADDPVPTDAVRADLSPGQDATWHRRVTGGPGVMIGVVASVGLVALAVITQLWPLLW